MKTPTKKSAKKKKTETGQKPIGIDLTPTLKETVVFSWGRMNPPTKGHEKLVSEMNSVDGDKIIYLSHSENSKRNPLSYEDKLFYAQEAFGEIIQDSEFLNINEALKHLGSEYSDIIMFVGEDRKAEFEKMFEKSNKEHFHFESWEVRSAGNRRPDSDDISGISASTLREACVGEDVEGILRCLPESLYDYAEEISTKVRNIFDLSESIKIVQKLKNRKMVENCKNIIKTASKRIFS